MSEARIPEWLTSIFKADAVVTSVLTLMETQRALLRAERQNLITAGECQKLYGILARASSAWTLMEISGQVRERAARAFPAEPVRTLEALHLATALLFMQVYPDLRILTHDRRIADNAQALGIG